MHVRACCALVHMDVKSIENANRFANDLIVHTGCCVYNKGMIHMTDVWQAKTLAYASNQASCDYIIEWI